MEPSSSTSKGKGKSSLITVPENTTDDNVSTLVQSKPVQKPDVDLNVPPEVVTLYRAALDGDLEKVKSIVANDSTMKDKHITKKEETVLHIATAAKHLHIVEYLVKDMNHESLRLANKDGNTALCFAAVTGIVEIAKVMMDRGRELGIEPQYIRGNGDMTPLLMAVLLGHQQMANYLLKVTDLSELTLEDCMNLLTSSIDTNLFGVAKEILQKNKKLLAVSRNGNGETALHALARKPMKCCGNQLSMWQNFKLKWSSITNQQNSEELDLIRSLWEEMIKRDAKDVSILIGRPWRLLFVAAELGKVDFLTVLIRSYPDCIWKVDKNSYTIFHFAVMHRHEEIFKLIYEIGAIKDLIATLKDKNGNNMLHLASKLAPTNRLNTVSGAALQMQLEILWFEGVKKIMRPEFTEAKNKKGETPQALFTKTHKELRAKGEEWMRKTAESYALVATLIVTVAFSAIFQLPGGVDKGRPVLMKSPYFMAFVISDAISLLTSTSSILMFLSILTSRYSESDFRESLPRKLMWGLVLLLISIATMIIAFTSTLFIIFHEAVNWIWIPISLIAFIPVALFLFQQFPLLGDIYLSTYRSQLIFEPTKRRLFGHPSQLDDQILNGLAGSGTAAQAPPMQPIFPSSESVNISIDPGNSPSVPSSCPSSVPSSCPSSVPSSVPSSCPSSVPSSYPSSVPSSCPSSVPSSPRQDACPVPSLTPSAIVDFGPSVPSQPWKKHK